MTGIWTAVYRNHESIITVIADSEGAARERIRKELNRPGRDHFLYRWMADGAKIVERKEPTSG